MGPEEGDWNSDGAGDHVLKEQVEGAEQASLEKRGLRGARITISDGLSCRGGNELVLRCFEGGGPGQRGLDYNKGDLN